MTTEKKNEVIVALKEKFSQYNNFYLTNTESLSVAQFSELRRTCFSKNVEMKVAKNKLIKKALEGINEEYYKGTFDSLKGVTALMFSESPTLSGLKQQIPRTISTIFTPLCEAAYSSSMMSLSSSEFTLKQIPAGLPCSALSASFLI